MPSKRVISSNQLAYIPGRDPRIVHYAHFLRQYTPKLSISASNAFWFCSWLTSLHLNSYQIVESWAEDLIQPWVGNEEEERTSNAFCGKSWDCDELSGKRTGLCSLVELSTIFVFKKFIWPVFEVVPHVVRRSFNVVSNTGHHDRLCLLRHGA